MIIKNIEDKISSCYLNETVQYTDFMTMEEIASAETILSNSGLIYRFWGGYELAERKMLMLSMDDTTAQFPFTVLSGTWDRFFEISHRDVLGAVMACGIERKCIGDILLDTSRRKFYLFIVSHMSDYVINNVSQIGKCSVVWNIVNDLTALPEKTANIIKISVSSLRIDAVIAAAFHLSRQKAQEVIAGKKVYLNHMLVNKVTQNIQVGDTVVLRGNGKIIFSEKCGFSKKGKLYILIKQYN